MPSDHLNPHHDEDSEARLDLLDQLDQYDHVDGLDQDDSHERYTHDELAFEEDWMPDDHWQE